MEINIYGEHKIEAKQTSAGVWRGSIIINTGSVMDGIALTDKAISELKKVLNKHNRDGNGKNKDK